MQFLFWLLIPSCVCRPPVVHGADHLSATTQGALQKQKLIYVSTKRANGEWSSRSAVRFMYEKDAVYFITAPSSHKVRQIGRGSPTQLSLGKDDEAVLSGAAQIAKDPAIIDRVDRAYRRKYWTAWFTYWAMPLAGRVESGKMVVVQVQATEQSAALEFTTSLLEERHGKHPSRSPRDPRPYQGIHQ